MKVDKKYIAAIKAGVIGFFLILLLGLFVYYMYERDQYNYWHSDAPRHYDNFCVGVLWIPFFLIGLVFIAAAIGGLAVRIAGAPATSLADAIRVSAVASFVTWCINMVALAFLGSIMRFMAHTEGSFIGDLITLMNISLGLTGYLLVQTLISIVGGMEEAYRRLKKDKR